MQAKKVTQQPLSLLTVFMNSFFIYTSLWEPAFQGFTWQDCFNCQTNQTATSRYCYFLLPSKFSADKYEI